MQAVIIIFFQCFNNMVSVFRTPCHIVNNNASTLGFDDCVLTLQWNGYTNANERQQKRAFY